MNKASSRSLIPYLAIILGLVLSIDIARADIARADIARADVVRAKTGNRTQTSFNRGKTELAQINPIIGCQRLTYSPFGVIYDSEIRMNGYTGIMVTRFFNQNTNRSEIVQQTVQLASAPQGWVIAGSNPVYWGTNIRHPTYSPDNFLFQIQPNGTYTAIAYDRLGRTAPVNISNCAVG